MLRAGAGVLALLGLAGCTNDVPTATGSDLFPGATEMTSIAILVPADQFLSGDTVYDGYTGVGNAGYLLAANRFDGELDAHALARFGTFPDSVSYTVGGTRVTDKTFTYSSGRITALIDTVASVPAGSVVLRLYALEQPWDSVNVSWTHASDAPAPTVAWATPGGSLGDLIAEATWVRGDTLRRDSIVWQIDSLAMNRIATPGFAGLAATAAVPGARVQFSRLALTGSVRPATHPDTTVEVTPLTSVQTFIFDPPPPQAATAFRAGGFTGARTILRLRLDHQVPSCADPTAGCPLIPLRDVTLNGAQLLLDPLPVPSGFRPTVPQFLQLRRLLEPDLGRKSALSEVLVQDTAAVVFSGPSGPQTASVNVTNILRAFADSSSIDLALMSTTQSASFGVLWFSRSPRLRLIYTLPRTPTLP